MPLLRRASARTAGLLLSVGILLVFAGVVTFFVVRHPRGGRPASPPPSVEPDPALVPAKDGLPNPPSRFGGGAGFHLQVVDKDDPSVVRAELSAARSTPIQGQAYRVALDQPVIWFFLKDGRTVHARADKGTAYLPDQGAGSAPGRPQDGIMEGNVIARVFRPRADGARPDPEVDEPLLVARTASVRFDAELGSVEAPERVEINHPAADFVGSGVLVLFNDVRQRLELLSVARPEKLVIRPDAAERDELLSGVKPPEKSERPAQRAGGSASSGSSSSRTAPARTPTTAPAAAPVEDLYHLVADGPGSSVKVTQGSRTIAAETMELWVRLVNNKLRPGAIMTSNVPRTVAKVQPSPTPPSSPSSSSPSKPRATTTIAAEPAPAVPQPAPIAVDSDEPVEITWTGPLKVMPVESASELVYNDVLARFTSQSDHGVTIADEAAGTRGTGSMLEYGATRREVVLAGRSGARLESEASGLAVGSSFELSLVTGIARVPGAGELHGTGSKPRSLSWNNQAEFHFKLDERKEVTQVVTKVIADGSVKATDGDATLSGGALHATLVPVDAVTSRLQTLNLIGKARAEDGRGGELASDMLDVTFTAAPDDPRNADPRLVTARGGVRAEREGSVLESTELEAAIARTGEKQELTATRIDAKEAVFIDRDGTRASAPKLWADPIARVARLEGPHGSVRVQREGATIEGRDMTFRDAERQLAVAGPGKFTHNSQARGEAPITAVVATWTDSMNFDDLAGTVECVGDAEAVMTTAEGGAITQRDTLKAQRVALWLTPAGANDADRELLRAELTGDNAPATIETRRFTRPAADQPSELEQLMYLESARISADDRAGTLETPGAGRFLVLDRRAAEQVRPDEPFGGGRGTSMFTWNGSMRLDRAKGLVTLLEGVKLTHQRAGDNVVSELDCEKLTAVVREQPGESDARSFSGELVSAEAEGGVWIRANGRELIADRASYDAINRVLTARASPGNYVEVFDPGAVTPRTARELRWDMVKDRIDIVNPGSGTGPRR
jgi:hypothetical protein